VLGFAAPAGSHPGHAFPTISIANHAFTPADLQVYVGDTVMFSWDGPDTNHSATADNGAFDTDPGKPPALILHQAGDAFATQFMKAGTVAFHCKVHPDMKGTVTVLPVPGAAAPAPPPAFSHVRATPTKLCSRRSRNCRHPGTLLRYTLSGPGDVQARITRRTGGRLLKEVDFSAPPGPGKRRIGFGSLRPGRYRITLVAVDVASGEPGPKARVDVAVRR
jgi:plastocyanin